MFPASLAAFVRLADHHWRVGGAASAHLAVAVGGGRGRRAGRSLWRRLGSIAALRIPDSRLLYRCKELDLAAHGFAWGDEATDRTLAVELLAARARRLASGAPRVHSAQSG